MDILYYSNFCPNCKEVLQFITKNSLMDRITCVNIDKRTQDFKTGQYSIELENGRRVILPPNVHSVPAILLTKENYRAIFGGSILEYLNPMIRKSEIEQQNGEPIGYALGQPSAATSNIVSEQYTAYDMSPDALSAKGRVGTRPIYNYVSASHDNLTIQTPPDTYRPDKLDENATIDNLQQKRNIEVPISIPPNMYGI